MFYKSYGHKNDDFIHLKDEIEILIWDRHLKQYKKKEGSHEEALETKSVEEGKESPDISTIPVAMIISRPKYFYFPYMKNFPQYFSSHSLWESFPAAMVIFDWGFNKHTMGCVKRRFKQLIKANSDMDSTLEKF